MIYLKKVPFQYDLNKQNVESAFRKTALKRNHSLDLLFESTNIGTDMLFLGYERKQELTFTRIRTSFERILPKLIISLPKDPEVDHYNIRFSLFTAIAFGFFLFALAIGIISLVSGKNTLNNFATICLFFFAFYLLLILELKITGARITKAINKYSESIVMP